MSSEGVIRIKEIAEKAEAERAKQVQEGDFSYKFDNDYDKIKADVNNDNKVDEAEYKKYIVEKTEANSGPLFNKLGTHANTTDKDNDIHHYYHLDNSVLIAFTILCITAIIITYLFLNKSKKSI